MFVVGAPRSGTTWLQRMLSVHPDVVALKSQLAAATAAARGEPLSR